MQISYRFWNTFELWDTSPLGQQRISEPGQPSWSSGMISYHILPDLVCCNQAFCNVLFSLEDLFCSFDWFCCWLSFSTASLSKSWVTVQYPTDFLNVQEMSGMPPHKLHLKVGCPVILMRNIDAPTLCNGTRLAVKALYNNVIKTTILTDQEIGLTTRPLYILYW